MKERITMCWWKEQETAEECNVSGKFDRRISSHYKILININIFCFNLILCCVEG